VSFCNHGRTVIANSTKGFKGWPVGLGLVVALFLFGALRAAINLKKETNEVVQASATPAVKETAVDTLTAMPAQKGAAGVAAASMTPIATTVEQPAATPAPLATTKPIAGPVERPAATPSPVATTRPTVTPKAVTAPSPTPKPGPLHRINNDVLAAYSKEDFTEMMNLYSIQDTDAVKQMVSEGKIVGLRKGALVHVEDIDVYNAIAKVRPKGTSTTVWIPSQFVSY